MPQIVPELHSRYFFEFSQRLFEFASATRTFVCLPRFDHSVIYYKEIESVLLDFTCCILSPFASKNIHIMSMS